MGAFSRSAGGGVALAVLLAAVGLARAATAASPTRLYISDERGGDVVIVDPEARRVVGRIAVGRRSRGIQISPDDRRLYVALSGSPAGGPNVDESTLPPPDRRYDGIGVVDVRSQKLISTYPAGTDPEAFALSHDGRMLYVSNEDDAALSAIDLTRGALHSSVRVGTEPEGVAVSRDNHVVYVTCESANSVYAVDAQTMHVLATIPTAKRPRAILLVREAGLGYVTDEFGAALTVFSTADYHVVKTIALGDPSRVRPMGIASRDGEVLDVTTGRFGALLEVDARSGHILRTIAHVGERPWGVALSPDGTEAYTANGPSGDVSVVDLKSGRILARIPTGGSPWGVVVGGGEPLSAGLR
jgi:YVTN family beta-propeller protein